jgi:hypothetical protein
VGLKLSVVWLFCSKSSVDKIAFLLLVSLEYTVAASCLPNDTLPVDNNIFLSLPPDVSVSFMKCSVVFFVLVTFLTLLDA